MTKAPFCIGFMHSAAVVAECFLCESLWISTSLCALRPCMAVRMQANAGDSCDTAAAAKFCGAVVC